MKVSPLELGRCARSWDERHLEMQAASRQIGDAPTAGFTGAVSGNAARFVATWRRHVQGLGDAAEATADGLRATATDMARTDGLIADDQLLLLGQLTEQR